MRYIWITNYEERSLKELANRAKMDWFPHSITSGHTVAQSDLLDLACGFQIENINLMTNEDVMNCYDIFVKYDVMDSTTRIELFKLFKERDVYKNGKLVKEN